MKHQVIVIHGGSSFKTHKASFLFLKKLKLDFNRYLNAINSWKKTLDVTLGKKFDVIRPDMPNSMDAKYSEWKIWFEKFIPYFQPEIVLVGHSLGGIFLAKYLSETKFPRKVRATFLVAPPFNADNFTLPKSLERLEAQGGKIFLYFSKDDAQVKFFNFGKYQKKLKNVTARIFKEKGHFNVPRLPELVKDIKNLYSY